MAVKTEQLGHGDAKPQYILCFIVNIVAFTYGVMIGWLAPMQPVLQANYTGTNYTSPLGEDAEPFSNEHISWITGFFCIGGLVGTPVYGYLANAIGRKKSTIACAVPFLIAYVLIVMADGPIMIYIARFIAGLGGSGICILAPMYIGETAEDNIRGVLGSYFNLLSCLGILFSFIIGSYTSYLFLGIISMTIPVIFLALSTWLPETPIYSLLNNRTEEARNTLIKLRGNHKELVETELKNLSSSVKEMLANKEQGMSLTDMLKEEETRKGLIIGLAVMTIQQYSGISPILNYTVAIFNASGSNLSANLAAIIVGSLQIIGAGTATIFMDRAGRKLLLMASAIGMGLSLAPIAWFFYAKRSANEEFLLSIGWLPVLSMACYIISYGVGFGPVPFVLVGEIFKTEARSTATSVCILAVWGLAFILLKFFSSLSDLIGIDGCFSLFSLICFAGAIFTYFYIPETKGKSLDEIMWLLKGNKPRNRGGSTAISVYPTDGKNAEIMKYNFPVNDIKDEKM